MNWFLIWQVTGFVSGVASVALMARRLRRAYPRPDWGLGWWVDRLCRVFDAFMYISLALLVGGAGAAGFGPLVAIIPALAYCNHGREGQ